MLIPVLLWSYRFTEVSVRCHAMASLENALPCILHLHNKRIEEKVMHMLYIISIFEASKNNTAAHCTYVIPNVLKMKPILTKAFGTVLEPGHHKFPINGKGEVTEVKFNDAWAQQIEVALLVLIPMVIKETKNDPDEWISCLTELGDIVDTLKQNEDFTNAEISALGVQSHYFSPRWIELCGEDGMTNDMHLICSGHILYFLRQ
jgi:hypothetical protein